MSTDMNMTAGDSMDAGDLAGNLAGDLEGALPHLAGAGTGWLDALRRDGLKRYREEGLPGPKTETWKYTGLKRAMRNGFVPAVPAAIAGSAVESGAALPADLPADLPAGPVAVCINGRFSPASSQLVDLPDGLSITSLAETLASDPDSLHGLLCTGEPRENMPMLALNTAAMEDGIVVRAAPGFASETPLHLIFANTGDVGDTAPPAFHPRLLVVVGDGAGLIVSESHTGNDAPYLANLAAEIAIGAGASLTHCKLQREGDAAVHVATALVALGAGGRYENFTMQLGGLLARNEIHVGLQDNADCRLAGAYAGRARQHIDNTTFVDHLRPNSRSMQVYRGALDERANGVFQGKIRICRDAQKTDGHQINKALLLSPEAEINSKPELEIYADDVQCGHGATAGELDEEQMFYMVSRGIPRPEARNMLIAAFLGEAIAEMSCAELRETFSEAAGTWLAGRRAPIDANGADHTRKRTGA